ncbi:hypothetical protein NPIL_56591 [Nephila pilipes]|uniref:Uncharacterized protein n=1 Tax=Nephila pilipes TaxID=299642 RepID=A0A8X6TSL7_NEPPI|nr:hypothetical protein NPIL_56591 [Nephila pilipes]
MGGSSCSSNKKRKCYGNPYTVNKKVDSDVNVTVTASAKKLDQRLIDDNQMKEKTLSASTTVRGVHRPTPHPDHHQRTFMLTSMPRRGLRESQTQQQAPQQGSSVVRFEKEAFSVRFQSRRFLLRLIRSNAS